MSPAMVEEEAGDGVVVFVVVISRVSCAPFGFFVFVEERDRRWWEVEPGDL
jgi:hypothetical protein